MESPEANEMRNDTRAEFQVKTGQMLNSKAYLDFCEEAYGYRLALLNMMDREQIDTRTGLLSLDTSDTLLIWVADPEAF